MGNGGTDERLEHLRSSAGGPSRLSHRRDGALRAGAIGIPRSLDGYEAVDGGWGYYDFEFQTKIPASYTASFMSAAVLIALHDAKQIVGVDPPQKLVERAIASINRQQKPDLSYLYGEYLRNMPV